MELGKVPVLASIERKKTPEGRGLPITATRSKHRNDTVVASIMVGTITIQTAYYFSSHSRKINSASHQTSTTLHHLVYDRLLALVADNSNSLFLLLDWLVAKVAHLLLGRLAVWLAILKDCLCCASTSICI